MKISTSSLVTPIYLKLGNDMPWPEDQKVFYLLAQNGLFLCRNHEFFRSSCPTDCWPSELAPHEASVHLSYPKIPQAIFETIIGFFDVIGERHGAEAAVLLAWNRTTNRIEVIVPEQESIVSRTQFGSSFPINVYYEVPPLPPHLMLIGDIHSHVYGAAYASCTDVEDEAHRPGLHIVVGRIHLDPPELHIEVTVDVNRFRVLDERMVIEGYQKRRCHEVPQNWIDQVTVKSWVRTYTANSNT